MSQTNNRNAASNSQPTKQIGPGVELVLAPERVEYLAKTYSLEPPQVLVVRNAICVGATDAELEFFLATCRRVNLDPFARQIWFVKRPQKITDARGNEQWLDVGRPETGIDGYRTIAERTGDYEGQGAMLWCGDDGKWLEVWLKKEPPRAAKATIYRKGFREALTHVALFDEFCPKYKNDRIPAMWQKMPANQLAKCAEAGGFRRAFPRDLSGLVTDTEMEHVDVASAGGFSAPPLPVNETKQLEAKKTSVQVPDVVDAREAVPVERKSAPKVEAPTTLADVVSKGEELYASLAKSEDDLDREMAKLVRELLDAKSRDDIGKTVGPIVAKAKHDVKTAKADGVEPDAYSLSVIDVVEPVLQLRWRELKGARS